LRAEIAGRLQGPDRVALQGFLAEMRVNLQNAPERDEALGLPPAAAQEESERLSRSEFGSAADAEAFERDSAERLATRRRRAEADSSINREIEVMTSPLNEFNIMARTMPVPPALGGTPPPSKPGAGPGGEGANPATNARPDVNGGAFPSGRWALTFDDGPSAAYTPSILDNLDRHGLKASFMWLATLAPHLTPIVTRANLDRMALCSHSYTHPNLTHLDASGLKHEVVEASAVLSSLYGYPVRAYRCPYGACGAAGSSIHQLIKGNRMTSVLWNVDSLDWHDHNPQSIYARVKKQMEIERGGIILFHDIHPQSVPASELVMADLAVGQQAGKMRVLTLHQALDEMAAGGVK
jgi:peptidoglycan/xylan/chitin deacetylase (PgdA/CDA1 family)